MSRIEVLKLTLVIVMLWFVSPATSTAAADIVVFPEGNAAADVNNVRAAVGVGGVVVLKAVNANGVPTPFEFGPSGTVLMSTDVTVLGETVDGRMTTIRGGFSPFRAVPFQPVRSVIRGIHFDAPRLAAVFLGNSTGFEFTGNVVTDVIGVPTPFGRKGQAVLIEGPPPGLPGITGTITIADNYVERVFADLSYGVSLSFFDATVRIANNTFLGTTETGILVTAGRGAVWIEDNTIVPGDQGFPGFFSSGNGIFVGQGSGAFYIRRNRVVCGNPFADGIALSGHLAVPGKVPASSVVEQNDVTMHGSQFGALTIYGQIDPTLFARNRVQGDGAFAILFTAFFGDEQTSGVVFQANNISKFRSTVSDVFFDTVVRDAVLVGHSGTVIDLGINNRITGKSKGEAIGPALQAAHSWKRELLRELQGALGQ